jgi:hypothetical protein
MRVQGAILIISPIMHIQDAGNRGLVVATAGKYQRVTLWLRILLTLRLISLLYPEVTRHLSSEGLEPPESRDICIVSERWVDPEIDRISW